MPSTAIFNDFRSPKFNRNRWRRSEYEIQDANLHHGDVRPFACPELIWSSVGNLQNLYPLPNCEFNGFTDGRDIVQGFCDDQHFHIFNNKLYQVTGSELCTSGTGAATKRAGAPYGIAPGVSAGCSGCDATGVAYVVTYVTQHAGIQVESAPSPSSTIVASGGDVPSANVTWGAAPSGFDVVATRLYRVETTFEDGTDSMVPQGAEFVFVKEFSGGGGGAHFDNASSHDTGGPLTTYEPMAFPAPDNLLGVVRTQDGIAVADEHRVYISLPGQPQFTFDGVVEIEDKILAIRAIQNTIFVFTDNKPYKIAYRHTDQVMSIDRDVIERKLPLTSKRSLSVYGNKIFFASTYSLYTWDTGAYGNDIKSILNDIITPEQWLQMEPETIRGTGYEYGYIFAGDGMDYSLMLELGEDGTDTRNGTSVMPITYIKANAFAVDHDGHIIYHENDKVFRWDYRRKGCGTFKIHDNVIPPLCDECNCCPWKMSMYYDNEGKNRFTRLRIEWDERSASHLEVNFIHKAFGEKSLIVGPLQVISSRGFSIPRHCSSQTFCVEVTGCGIMHEIRMATSSQELVSNSNNQIENRQLE